MLYGKITQLYIFVVVQLLSNIWLFVTPWTAVPQAPPSSTISRSLFRFMSIESMMVSNHLILLLPSVFPSISVFSSESALYIRWPKYWNFSISPSNEYSGLISFRVDWFDLLALQQTLKSLLQHHWRIDESIDSLALSLLYGPILTSVHDYW